MDEPAGLGEVAENGRKERSMRNRYFFILILGVVAACASAGCTAKPSADEAKTIANFPPNEAKAIAEIRRLGGSVTARNNSPGGPIVGVFLLGSRVTDAELVQLKVFTQLQSLRLWGTQVTDAGLAYLKGLTQLRGLDLTGTRVTDAGLVHLKSLSNLQSLYLSNTQVTEAGAQDLKTALPRVRLVIR
jgi:hypothetical protein